MCITSFWNIGRVKVQRMAHVWTGVLNTSENTSVVPMPSRSLGENWYYLPPHRFSPWHWVKSRRQNIASAMEILENKHLILWVWKRPLLHVNRQCQWLNVNKNFSHSHATLSVWEVSAKVESDHWGFHIFCK